MSDVENNTTIESNSNEGSRVMKEARRRRTRTKTTDVIDVVAPDDEASSGTRRRTRTRTTEDDDAGSVVVDPSISAAAADDSSSGTRRKTRTKTMERMETGGEGGVAADDSEAEDAMFDEEKEQEQEMQQFVVDRTESTHSKSLWMRQRDKLFFMLGIADVCLLAVGAFDNDFMFFLPYFYSLKFPILMINRFVSYRKSNFHWFLMDFCYWCNSALIILIWAFPDNPYYFMIMFALTNGPLAWAVPAFRNSLVLHSIDKITSLYIHVSPPILTYVLRWHTADVGRYWYKPFAVCTGNRSDADAGPGGAGNGPCSSGDGGGGGADWSLFFGNGTSVLDWEFFWLFLFPLCCFIGHGVLYFVIVQLMPCTKKIRRDRRYMTSFRWLTRSRSGLVFSFVSMCGRRMRPFMFGLFNWIFCAFTLLLVPVLWNYEYAQVAFLLIIVCLATWNGAGYYAVVFSRAYPDPQKPVRGGKQKNAAQHHHRQHKK